MRTLYWHDYETFGGDPRRSRPAQFAGIRTDEDLNIVGDPLMLYCKPAPDFLPDPVSCAITGIAPQAALRQGVDEIDFCRRIQQEFMEPGTCVVGYNSLRFDDEVTRHLLYRCFFDPYEREWKNGNSRWDLIDLVRMTHALRPDGIAWPKREDGFTSFRLEELTKANGIGHDSAHDALSDVRATIAMARLIRTTQPKLYQWYYEHRFKNALWPMLEPEKREPVVHISGMFPAGKGCMAVVIPLMKDPQNQNGVIVYDLSCDPDTWSHLPEEEIRLRLFTPRAELPEGVERIPLKTIHVNKCPAVAPVSVLDEATRKRWQIDLRECKTNLDKLESISNLESILEQVFKPPKRGGGEEADVDFSLYSGAFFTHADKARMSNVHRLLPEELATRQPVFQDPRLPLMLFRLRARNWPHTLNTEELHDWREFCFNRLSDGCGGQPGWREFWQSLAEARQQYPHRSAVFDELASYAGSLGDPYGLSPPEVVLDEG